MSVLLDSPVTFIGTTTSHHVDPNSLQGRYRDGQRRQVWQEMSRAGAALLRHPGYRSDAEAVARETMLRARDNVETLILRLQSLGYQFYTGEDAARETLETLAQMMQAVAHSDAAEVRGRIDLLRLSEECAVGQAAALSPLEHPDVWTRPDAGTRQLIEQIEGFSQASLPLSLRAWMEVVGEVSLLGYHECLGLRRSSGLPELLPMYSSGSPVPAAPTPDCGDPLVVRPIFDARRCQLILSPDREQKSDPRTDGFYRMQLSSEPAVDAIFEDDRGLPFVDYLRLAFECGGFPGYYGMEPSKELRFLSSGLLEI